MYLLLKRIIDIIISSIVLILLLPIFLIIAIVLLCTGEHEVFYFQKRIGLNQKRFDIWKFATMLKNSMNMGSGSITLKNDSRVTNVGRFLRITKINELPQIINVLKGDMSIVGPRPLVDKTFTAYTDEVQKKVYDSKPGITGIGSIVFRNEEKLISESGEEPHKFYQRVVAPYKGDLEMWYQGNKSTWVDVKLIFATAWLIIFSDSQIYKSWFDGLPEDLLDVDKL